MCRQVGSGPDARMKPGEGRVQRRQHLGHVVIANEADEAFWRSRLGGECRGCANQQKAAPVEETRHLLSALEERARLNHLRGAQRHVRALLKHDGLTLTTEDEAEEFLCCRTKP